MSGRNRRMRGRGNLVIEIPMTAHAQPAVRNPVAARPWLLFAIEVVVALNAIGGAIWGLDGAKNVPREWLEGTPFDSYVVPSLILLVAVGGSMALAALALAARHRLAPELSVIAGLSLMGWIATQVVLIAPNGGVSWLQPTMFAAGLLVAALGRRLRRAEGHARGGRS